MMFNDERIKWGHNSVVECLPSMHKALGLTSITTHAGHDAHICVNSSTWEIKARGLDVQGQPWLHSEFEASAGHDTVVCFVYLQYSKGGDRWIPGLQSKFHVSQGITKTLILREKKEQEKEKKCEK